MKKLTLDLEALEVDSFETAERVQENGTVKAHGWSDDSICPTVTPGRPPLY